jgi:molybdopterin molybdotransferase
MAEALSASDMLLVSGGSSASTRDMTADAAAALGSPGILVHGINIRPGKPTILAACDGKAVVGLPGNPVSALVIAYLFVVPVIARLLGLPADRPKPRLTARLTVNLRSQAGREDWWPVKLIPPDAGLAEWRAEPIFGKSNLIFSLVAADGLARIAPEANGASAGEIVDVQLM